MKNGESWEVEAVRRCGGRIRRMGFKKRARVITETAADVASTNAAERSSSYTATQASAEATARGGAPADATTSASATADAAASASADAAARTSMRRRGRLPRFGRRQHCLEDGEYEVPSMQRHVRRATHGRELVCARLDVLADVRRDGGHQRRAYLRLALTAHVGQRRGVAEAREEAVPERASRRERRCVQRRAGAVLTVVAPDRVRG